MGVRIQCRFDRGRVGVRFQCRFDRGRVGRRYVLTGALYIILELEDQRLSVTLYQATKT